MVDRLADPVMDQYTKADTSDGKGILDRVVEIVFPFGVCHALHGHPAWQAHWNRALTGGS